MLITSVIKKYMLIQTKHKKINPISKLMKTNEEQKIKMQRMRK